MPNRLTAIIHREDDGYVALCPEIDVVSQGDTVEQARDNLRDAVEMFLECASPAEVQEWLGEEVFFTPIEVSVGSDACVIASPAATDKYRLLQYLRCQVVSRYRRWQTVRDADLECPAPHV